MKDQDIRKYFPIVIFTLTTFLALAKSEKAKNLEGNSSFTSTYAKNETYHKNSNVEENLLKDPLLIVWIVIGVVGFLFMFFVACYCLFKCCDGRKNKQAPERSVPEQPGSKKVEVLEALEEEGQVIELLQMLQASSRRSLERNLTPPKKEDFENGNRFSGSGHKSASFIPQKPQTKHNDGDGFCPPPFSNSDGQRHQEKIFFNYGFEGTEETFGSEFGHLGYDGELYNQQSDRHYGSFRAGQTHVHRRLWYEDSFNDSNNIDIFPVNRLEQSCAATDRSSLRHHYLNDAQRDTGLISEGSEELVNGPQFCKIEVNDALPNVTEESVGVETITVKSDFIQEDKGNVQDSMSYSPFDRTNQKEKHFDSSKTKDQKPVGKNSLKRGTDLEELDDVEFVEASYGKRSCPERSIIATHSADEDRVYRELLRGSVVALAIANGSTDVNLSSSNVKPEQNKVPSRQQPAFVFQREKRRSYKPNDYGSLVNEHKNTKPKLEQHSIVKRISKKRRDSKQRFKNSVIGKKTRKLSKKVVKGLKMVRPKTKSQSSRHLPAFVIASF